MKQLDANQVRNIVANSYSTSGPTADLGIAETITETCLVYRISDLPEVITPANSGEYRTERFVYNRDTDPAQLEKSALEKLAIVLRIREEQAWEEDQLNRDAEALYEASVSDDDQLARSYTALSLSAKDKYRRMARAARARFGGGAA